jgi:hypothetical protein
MTDMAKEPFERFCRLQVTDDENDRGNICAVRLLTPELFDIDNTECPYADAWQAQTGQSNDNPPISPCADYKPSAEALQNTQRLLDVVVEFLGVPVFP